MRIQAMFTIILIGSIWVTLIPSEGSVSNEVEISLHYSFSKPILETISFYGENFTRVNIEGCKLYGKTGEPKLPVKPIRLLLPQGKAVKEIHVETGEPIKLAEGIKNIELGDKVYPLSSPPPTSPPSPGYNKSQIYPNSLFNSIGIQYFRGFPILHINLHPVQYLGDTGTLFYYPDMSLTIETKPSNISPLYRGLDEDKKAVMKKLDIVDERILSTYQTSSFSGERFEYVIITTESFKKYNGTYDFHTLIEKRKADGLSSTIKSVEEIYDEFPGVDPQEKIRNFIKYAYENWGTNWILLGGDVEFVPVRMLWDIDGADSQLASDTYYQCLDGTYNYDNDSIYGEKYDGVDGGIIDLYAEVYIGRASVDSYEQIENFVRKTITYESSRWGLDDYLKNVDSVGEYVWSGAGGWGAGYVERCIDHCTDYGQDTHGIPSGLYNINRRYERDKRYDSIDLIEDFYNGVNLINHLGHSSPTYCMRFNPTKIASLKNTDYGFWYSQGCHPGQFQAADECIAEAWTVYENGGFAAIMNTGYGYGSNTDYDGPDNRFAREFWDALNYSEEKISRLGEANQDSKEDNMWHIDDGNAMYHNCYSTTLFGDPFVEIKGMEDFRADFIWKPDYPKRGDTLYFTDLSLNADRVHWDFGDGTSSDERNPSHIYETEGIYKVNLTIYNSEGRSNFCIKNVEIWENWPPISIPQPELLAVDTNAISFWGNESWDPDGSIVDYHWDFDDGSTADGITTRHTFADDGIYHVILTVTDNQGKKSNGSCEIRIDQHTPPETDAVIGGEHGKNDWFISPVYISLSASDWSGVKKSKFRIDNGNWETYRIPKTISTPGIHTIDYYSVDIWGSEEDIKTEEFKIDTTPPTLKVNIKGEKQQGWYINPVEIDFDASDDYSGLDRIMYLLTPENDEWMEYKEPLSISKDGRYTLRVYAEDKAGLTEGKNLSYTFGIDLSPPYTTYTLTGDPSPGGYIIVDLKAIDNGSGVYSTRYSIDNSMLEEYNAPFKVTGDGEHTITFYSIDILGHIEPKKTVSFTIGETPTITITNPQTGLYLNNEKIISLPITMVIGSIDVNCEFKPGFLSPEKVIFYVNGKQKYIDDTPPYNWRWNDHTLGRKKLYVEAVFDGKKVVDDIVIYKLF
ncbi:MAG: hypothetical protein DRN12_06905 [Thermoplasmata archaeon]|nr:MAG: hypothetical protein DRN12_06905 [Thermoplasmata archaeon]